MSSGEQGGDDRSESVSVPDDPSSLLTPEMGQRAEDAMREAQKALLRSVDALIDAMEQIPEEHHSVLDSVRAELTMAAEQQVAARKALEEFTALQSASLGVIEEWLRHRKGTAGS